MQLRKWQLDQPERRRLGFLVTCPDCRKEYPGRVVGCQVSVMDCDCGSELAVSREGSVVTVVTGVSFRELGAK